MQTQQESVPVSIDAPVEGWDAYNSLDNMPPNAAVILNNLIPQAGHVVTRNGHMTFQDLGTDAPTETVASFYSESQSQLVAASGGGIFSMDNSDVGNVAPTMTEIAAAGTFANDRWQTENFRKADESGIMVMCNGEDVAQIYDGAALTPISTLGTDEDELPDFDPTFIGCLTFKGRMYYWYDNDNAFYYTQAGSYQGVFQKYDLGSFIRRGGKLVLITTWTQQDSGDGKDDFLVFVFSTGEILIYQGDDPETEGYFEMVGRYVTSEPLSIRSATQYGADTILMTRDGYVALSTIIQQGRTSDVHQFSYIIHNAIIERTQITLDVYGWDVRLFPRQGLMLFNIPLSDTVFEQHVMNTITQKWCRFKDFNVLCLVTHNERLFAGTPDGRVVALLEGTTDNGDAILYDCLTAFNYFDQPGIQKHIVAAQFISTVSSPASVQITGYADYEVPDITPLTIPASLVESAWDDSDWDEDYWSGEGTQATTKGWQNVSAHGYAVALMIRFYSASEQVVWRSTGMLYYSTGSQ